MSDDLGAVWCMYIPGWTSETHARQEWARAAEIGC